MLIGARTGAWKASGASGLIDVYKPETVSNIDGDLLIKFSYYVPTDGIAMGFVIPESLSGRVLVVGGGGGGGGVSRNNNVYNYNNDGGGGGGAGGFVDSQFVFADGEYDVYVGAGGGPARNLLPSISIKLVGDNGESSTISLGGDIIFKAVGGGGGGGAYNGSDGGSGGGGSSCYWKASSTYAKISSVGGSHSAESQTYANIGHCGGSGSPVEESYNGAGGGGGGAGGSGCNGNSTSYGVGGVGLQSNISVPYSTPQSDWPWYAAGGGGGKWEITTGSSVGILGGSGIGGQGGIGDTPVESGRATQGVDGTGSGGGGAGNSRSTPTARKGGSGIVFVRIYGGYSKLGNVVWRT